MMTYDHEFEILLINGSHCLFVSKYNL